MIVCLSLCVKTRMREMAFACAVCVCFIRQGINQRRDSKTHPPTHPPTRVDFKEQRGGIARASCQDVKYMLASRVGWLRAPPDYLFREVSSLNPSPPPPASSSLSPPLDCRRCLCCAAEHLRPPSCSQRRGHHRERERRVMRVR